MLSYISALPESHESLLLPSTSVGMGHLGHVPAKESSPCQIPTRQGWVPHGTLVLYVSSLRTLSLHSYQIVILANLLPFCGNGTSFFLLPELEQPFLLPYPVTWALFLSSNLACATGYCWYFLCYVMTEWNNAQVSPRCLTQLLQLAQETHCFKQE